MGRTRTGRRGLSRDEVKIAVKRALDRVGANGATKAELVATIGAGKTSLQTVQRALVELRDADAQIECFGRERRWRLVEPFGMPLEAPDREDLLAVLIAQAILEPLADDELRATLARLVADLDERVRSREPEGARHELPQQSAVSAALTLGTRVDTSTLRTLVSSCKRKVLRVLYESPWKPASEARRWYEVEPWALRVHDGAVYLRGWTRDAKAARTFRVAQIEEVVETKLKPSGAVPVKAKIWGDENPAFGIDHDRPATAVVRLRGAVARWIARVVWHPGQEDRWIEEGELLERTVAYRSCREMARRLASVIDAVEAIEPAELRAEVESLVGGVRSVAQHRASKLDDLRGIMQRVRPGARDDRAAESAVVSRAAEETGTTWKGDEQG